MSNDTETRIPEDAVCQDADKSQPVHVIRDPEIPPWKMVPTPFDKFDVTGGYRLGDMIASMYRWDPQWGQQYHFKKFPRSMASMYMRATEENENWSILNECIRRKFGSREKDLQVQRQLVVHLRVGDVMDDDHARQIPVQRFLSHWTVKWRGGYYVVPKAYYENFEIPNNVKKFVIIANPYFHVNEGIEPRNSKAYISAIVQVFQEKGIEVEARITSNQADVTCSDERADEDFALAVSAEALIISGGNFGRALGNVAKVRGLAVWRPPQMKSIQHLLDIKLEGESAKDCQLEEFQTGDAWEPLVGFRR